MANDGRIFITISDKRGGTGVGKEPETQQETQQVDRVKEMAWHQFQNSIVSNAKTAVRYTLGNIGNFTGDYTSQRAYDVGTFITNRIIGGVSAGVAGGWIGAGIAVAGYIETDILSTISQYIDNKHTNYQLEQMRKASGLDSLTNGSR